MSSSSPSDNNMDQLQDTLFLILTRPPTRWGVPFEALICNGILTFFIGLWLGNPLFWAVGLIIHFPMRVIASKDHNFFRIGRLWLMAKFEAVKSSMWGGSMLSPLPTGLSNVKERASCV
jgi:type IV secretory pathway VirB3-like protein